MRPITPAQFSIFFKTTKTFENVLAKVKIISIDKGNCIAEMKVDEEHTNILGGLHGGFSATLVDNISTYALATHKNGPLPTVSVDLHLSYLKGAKMGDEIEIDARTVKAGKNLAFLEIIVKNKATGDVLLTGSHTKYYVRKL